MTDWALLLCEGAHDQMALRALACACGGWEPDEKVPHSLPVGLLKTFPRPAPNKYGASVVDRFPSYLRKGGRYLIIRELGGCAKVLGSVAVSLLQQVDPTGVGVVVDADDAGVKTRLDAFRDTFRAIYSHVDEVHPGTVVTGKPSLGLWVAPNNHENGRLDQIMLKWATAAKPELTKAGGSFIAKLKKIAKGKWEQKEEKALLGAVHQCQIPGGSLAVGLKESRCWLNEDSANEETITKLLSFINMLFR